MTLAGLLVAVGTVVATLGADRAARLEVEASQQEFRQSSAEIASNLELAIEHQRDLVVNASGFVVANPEATESDFRAWASSVHVLDRYPEVLGFGFVAVVPASDLPDFTSKVVADPPTVLSAQGTVQIQPPGQRPFYCLTELGQIRSVEVGTAAGLDWCAAPGLGPAVLQARDAGRGTYSPVGVGSDQMLSVNVPVYEKGVTPMTVPGRRKAILGWVTTESVPAYLLDHALQGHPRTSATLRYRDSTSDVQFSRGQAPATQQDVTIDLNNGWSVRVAGPVVDGNLFHNGKALTVLLFGALVSALLGTLVLVLATGRARALRLVDIRTRQLRGAQAKLVDAARQAGMAEIAVNVLHNVGNVLNSVNVSADLVHEKVRSSKAAGLGRAVGLMHQHKEDLGDFLTSDQHGRHLVAYLDKLSVALNGERQSMDEELRRLRTGVEHIGEIIHAQQSLAGVKDVLEPVRMNDVVDDALRMAGVFDGQDLKVSRDIADCETLLLDRHRTLLILVNLFTNARQATSRNTERHGQIRVRGEVVDDGQRLRITVTDNGDGIGPDDLAQVFEHGYTTRADGHGFGLHSSAIAAREMGGSLNACSDGAGTGASFTLDVPLSREPVMA